MDQISKPSASLAERFWPKVQQSETGCWEWCAGSDKDGYGLLRIPLEGEHVTKRATHVAWFLETGHWPRLNILHTCDNTACVRFEHLFEGTVTDNNRDCAAKGRACNGSGLCNKTHCIRGHLLSGSNLYIQPSTGGRHCRTCKRDWEREQYRRRKSK